MVTITGFPQLRDPRIPVALILFSYLILGVTTLGFNRSPLQMLIVIAMACSIDVLLHRLVYRQWLFPLSALITGMSLSILVNYAHGSLLPVIPVIMAIASKYLITYRGRHVYNPALFGIVSALLLGGDMMSVSPAYQWGGYPAIAIFIVTAAIVTFVLKINRLVLVFSFLGFYTLALCVRAWLTQHHVPPHVLFMGALTAPAFYLFVFFMITDPATSPVSRRAQFFAAFAIVSIDFYLHTIESLYTFFYAGFIFFSIRFVWLHGRDWLLLPFTRPGTLAALQRVACVVLLGLGGWLFSQQLQVFDLKKSLDFKLVSIPVSQSGLQASDGKVLSLVDPRIQHIAKWVLSVGDAVAVADYDNDGLQDIFLTYPLKNAEDRGALYRNLGQFRFKRIHLPAITERMADETSGLPSAALWFDYDNDADADLLIGMGYGKNLLLRNNLTETGRAEFTDVSAIVGVDDYSVTLTANAFDADNDGHLDLLVGNSLNPWLPDYPVPTQLNIFDLPQAVNEKDRRMFNFMHRTWHDADNGGENYFYIYDGGQFKQQAAALSGLSGNRWTIDIGTGDLDNDGDTDLYLANDFGPDELFVNNSGHFSRSKGRFSGEVGADTYKGMNASIADFDNNGALDVYVSNVHEPLQAEGSLLWMNDGSMASSGWRALRDQASSKNALNERRFGWGATAADLNLDGRQDLLQANGMVGDKYDNLYEGCPDYWYWNDQIALTGPDVHGYADQWADLRGRCIFPDEPDRVMLNEGRYFVDVAAAVGWLNHDSSRGIATADFDNDGDPDVIVTHQFSAAAVYKNDANHNHHWIGFDLVGDGHSCNTDAIGSRVTITPVKTDDHAIDSGDWTQQIREVVASNGFSSQNDSRVLFGLGEYSRKINVQVSWCGQTRRDYQFSPDRYHRLQQSAQVATLNVNPSN